MEWHPDVPELPFTKPKKIEDLEKKDRKFYDSMPPQEVDKLVDDAAMAIAQAYYTQCRKNSYEECIEMVSSALEVTGSAIGGHVGSHMVSSQNESAKKACRLLFSKDED